MAGVSCDCRRAVVHTAKKLEPRKPRPLLMDHHHDDERQEK
jgi:hypothetical protein